MISGIRVGAAHGQLVCCRRDAHALLQSPSAGCHALIGMGCTGDSPSRGLQCLSTLLEFV